MKTVGAREEAHDFQEALRGLFARDEAALGGDGQRHHAEAVAAERNEIGVARQNFGREAGERCAASQ